MKPILPFFLTFLLCFSLFAQKKKKSQIDPSRIEIVRDSFGVAHVFAPTDAECAYGIAWATAEDDFTLPQWFLMAITGNMGRYEGKDGAAIDFAVKWTRVNDLTEERYEEELSPEFRAVLEGYAAGSNAYAKAHPKEVTCKKCFPVTGKDIAAGHMLGLALMGGIDGKIRHIINGGIKRDIPVKDEGVGSNGFAFNRDHTQEGEVFLGINSHQPIEGLLSFYEMHICSEEGWNIVGAMFHGSPVIFEGTNEYLGWGHTTGDVDNADYFQLEMHPKKKNTYRIDDEWHQLDQRRVKLVVGLGKKKKFRIPVWKKTWMSEFGPTLVTDDGAFAIRMPALLEITPAEQWYRMDKATTFSEFYKALEIQGISHQNITYADRNDTIFQIAHGLFPVRNPEHDWTKVVPGNTYKNLWTEYHPVSRYAQFLNPESGYVFNCNNSAFDGADRTECLDPQFCPPNMGYKFPKSTNRSRRFHELMEKEFTGQISYEDFKTIKFDNVFPDSMTMLNNYSLMELFEMTSQSHPDIAEALTCVKRWEPTRGTDISDTNATVVICAAYFLNETVRGKDKQQMKRDPEFRKQKIAECLGRAQSHLKEHFGKITIPLGEFQVHQRGDKELPISGGPDVLRAVYTNGFEKGKRRMYLGDGYVQMVHFPKEGLPIIESVNAYGSSNKPGADHYNDQMEMFVDQKFKKMPLKKEEVFKMALKIYHPE